MTRNGVDPRLTIEILAQDCLDVRELYKARVLDGEWVTFRWPELRWPAVRKMRAARYRVLIELVNQVVPQQVHVSWTKCNYGGARPWLHCLCGRRVARLFKGFGGYYCRPCCGNPVYESQTRNKKARAHLQAYRTRQLLGRLHGRALAFHICRASTSTFATKCLHNRASDAARSTEHDCVSPSQT